MTCACVSKHAQIPLVEISMWTNVHIYFFLLEEKLSCLQNGKLLNDHRHI